MFVLGLSIFPPLLAALAMAREGEQQTILQVYVSGITAHEFLLGKIFAGQLPAAADGVRVLRADGDRHRNVLGHARALGHAGAADPVLREPAAHGALGLVHPDRGDAEVDLARDDREPDRALRGAGTRVMVKGAGLDVVYPSLFALMLIATVLVGMSTSRFRTQMR
jgi:hypothetical protein